MRDMLAGELPAELSDQELATSNLWLFRLASSLTRHGLSVASPSRIGGMGVDEAKRVAREIADQLAGLTVVPMIEIYWSMAEHQERHRQAGRPLSAAMVEALAAAHFLECGIAVAHADVGPALKSAAEIDGVPFVVFAAP